MKNYPYYYKTEDCFFYINEKKQIEEHYHLLDCFESLSKKNLCFEFNCGKEFINDEAKDYQHHEHYFEHVLDMVYDYPETFSIKGFEDEYSKQEIEMINAVQKRCLELGFKDICLYSCYNKDCIGYDLEELEKRNYKVMLEGLKDKI